MKTRHMALFGLDGSSREDDVTHLEWAFLFTFSYILSFLPLSLQSPFFQAFAMSANLVFI